MRKSILTSLVLTVGAFLGLVSLGANATPIHVSLLAASGHQSWTSPVIGDPHGTLTLSGWEWDTNAGGGAGWAPATMIYKNEGFGETGLGVLCNQTPNGNACGQHEIGATPWQMIDVNIGALTGWGSVTINLGSVNKAGSGGFETGYLLGASCTVGGGCGFTTLASCTNNVEVCTFTFTKQELSGITNIWVTPSTTNMSGKTNANILMGGYFTLNTVPEPAELGIFGLGILMIGVLVGLRRRQTH